MAIAHFTEYEATQLINVRKFVFRIIRDNSRDKNRADTGIQIAYDIHRRDMPETPIHLVLYARLAPWVRGTLKPLPGVSLRWWERYIRKIDRATRHDSTRHGVSVGHIEGWHEHIWTEEDEEKYAVPANPPVKGQDIRSLIRWSADKWNIELGKILDQEELDL